MSTVPVPGLTPELIDRVMKLSPSEKDHLVGILLDDFGSPETIDKEQAMWRAEIARRIEAVRCGQIELLDADESIRRLREKYGEADSE